MTRVRVASGRLTEALELGLARSSTLCELVDRLEESDLIVHIATEQPRRDPVVGRLRFVTATTHTRYLRVTIREDLRLDEMAAMIGHELQHALEVAEHPSVVDDASLEALYESIGFTPRPGHHETLAAQIVAARVLQDITQRPVPGAPHHP